MLAGRSYNIDTFCFRQQTLFGAISSYVCVCVCLCIVINVILCLCNEISRSEPHHNLQGCTVDEIDYLFNSLSKPQFGANDSVNIAYLDHIYCLVFNFGC